MFRLQDLLVDVEKRNHADKVCTCRLLVMVSRSTQCMRWMVRDRETVYIACNTRKQIKPARHELADNTAYSFFLHSPFLNKEPCDTTRWAGVEAQLQDIEQSTRDVSRVRWSKSR